MSGSDAAPPEDEDRATQKCGGCKQLLPLAAFPLKKTGAGAHEDRTKTCADCAARKKDWRDKRKAGKGKGVDKEGDEGVETNDEPESTPPSEDLDELTLRSFLQFLEGQKAPYHVEARVSVPDQDGDRRRRADSLAESIWEKLNYRFIYHSARAAKTSNGTRATYIYHCAQFSKRQKKPQKIPDQTKHRDKEAMEGFDCHGWLNITVSDSSDTPLSVTLGHRLEHIPYVPIDLPDSVVALVRENPSMKPHQLWKEVLKKYPQPTFSRKAVYAKWAQYDRANWRRDEDELKSAKILLEQARLLAGPRAIEPISLPDEEGFHGVAFAIPEHLRQWGGRVREIALDSTFKTNQTGFELFALLGEVYGSGLPLGYLLVRSNGGEKGGLQRYLMQFLAVIRDKWFLHAIFTVTDKNWSEINACQAVFPDAKHQLCYWHCLRAVKTRLSILRRVPAHYNVDEARTEYSWISEDFVPLRQQANPSNPAYVAMEHAIPTIRLRFNGNIVPIRPELPIPDLAPENEDQEDAEASNDVRGQMERESTNIEVDAEDGPDWMFEEDEVRSSDPNYVFCPAPHRKQLLTIFTKHFCQHPLFPECNASDERDHSAKSIHHDAVWEMYTFCHVRGLTEVWGYLWNSWYSPRKWALWARSTSSRLSRLRTTMTVEKHWQQLKGDHLHHLVRPRLDQLVYILIYDVTPGYVARAGILEDTFRLGCSRPLTTYQDYFKKSWKALLNTPINSNAYNTHVASWTCNCGQQKYHPQHLCKHLVQAVGLPSTKFFHQIYRRRAPPLYMHPELRDKSDDSPLHSFADPDDGSITDGDDHVWLGDRAQLEKPTGWDSLEGGLTLRKRLRTATPSIAASDRSSSPLPYAEPGSEDEEEELDKRAKKLQRRAQELREAAEIIEAQLPHKNPIWIKSMVDRNVGKDVSLFVQDVRRVEETARQRDTTWGRPGDKGGQRRVRNTMGYQARVKEPELASTSASGASNAEAIVVEDSE